MSLVKNKNWKRIEEYVGDILVDIFYLDGDNNIYVIGTEAARFAEYDDPNNQASTTWKNIKENLPDEMKKLTSIGKLPIPYHHQKSRYYVNELVHFFIMNLGNKPKVSLLLQGYALIVEKFRKGDLLPNYHDKQLEVLDKLILAQTQAFQEVKVVKTEITTVKKEVKTVKTAVKKVGKRISKLETMVLSRDERKRKEGKIKELQWKLREEFMRLNGESKSKSLGRMTSYVDRRYRVSGYTNIPDQYIGEYILLLKNSIKICKVSDLMPYKFEYKNIPKVDRIKISTKQSGLEKHFRNNR